MIRFWNLTIFFILILIGVFILIQNSKTYDLKDFRGIWTADYKNYKIKFKLSDNNNCSFLIFFKTSNKIEKLDGKCNIDLTKKPNMFKMNNINQLSSPLYSIIFLKNKSTLHMSEFSYRWRIRPIEFDKNKKIIFKKEI